jgi:uncharacterized protein (DUF433 family)
MNNLERQTGSIRGELGQGLYSLAELRAFLALSGRLEDGRHAQRWLSDVLAPVRRTPRQPDHSFSDLISLFVVRELRREGVKPRTIREAEQHLRSVWQTDRPFVHDTIQTDGRDVFADGARITGQVEAASKQGQQVMLEVVKDMLRDVGYVDGAARTWMPDAHVVLDPAIQFGEPVLRGTRLLTVVVAEVASARDTDIAADRFRISREQADAAVAFERRLAAARN